MNKTLNYYQDKLGINDIPEFLIKYLNVPSLDRLKNIGYFCGMDYASKNIYNFKEYITRYDHSLSTALLTYKLTNNKEATLAALFHDISTPCFSHVIDYMNGDYEKQESTEEYTEMIIKKDKELLQLLKEDNIDVQNIIDFKRYTVVDNERPKLCADRIDGIILTGISWTKSVDEYKVDKIINSLDLYENEDNELEIGFNDYEVAQEVYDINEEINKYCHSDADNFMMKLLANMTNYAIRLGVITYDQLYTLSETDIIILFKYNKDNELKKLVDLFENIKLEEIPKTEVNNLKERTINPLVDGQRLTRSYTKRI